LTSDIPGFNFRAAMPDEYLPDGFHLSQAGAAAFGSLLAAELKRTFPSLGRGE
jgi:lysophospholipase L1-like esterase